MRLLWLLIIITSCQASSNKIKAGDTLKADTVIPVNSLPKTQQQPSTELKQELVTDEDEEEDNHSWQAEDLHYVNKNKVFIVFADEKKIRLSDYSKDPHQLDNKYNVPWCHFLYGKLDFDHDGKEELLLTFTPSAGWCSTVSYYIFEPIAPNTFKFAARLRTGSSENYRKKYNFPLVVSLKLFGCPGGSVREDWPDYSEYGNPIYIYKNNQFVLKKSSIKKLSKDILSELKSIQED